MKRSKGLARSRKPLPVNERPGRRDLLLQYRAVSTRCEVGPILDAGLASCRAAGAPVPHDVAHHRCTGHMGGLHERRKAKAAGSLSNPANLLRACNLCNGLIESEAGWVRQWTGTALVVREGDPEWADLSSRLDRFR